MRVTIRTLLTAAACVPLMVVTAISASATDGEAGDTGSTSGASEISAVAPETGPSASETREMLEDLQVAWEEAHNETADWGIDEVITVTESDGTLAVEVGEELKQRLAQELQRSELPRESEMRDGLIVTTYTVPEGPSVAVEQPLIQPRVSGGRNSIGVYVIFTPLEQDLIISGSGFVLATAICAIPAVGWVMCTATGLVITVATVFLSNRGKCKAPRERAKIYPFVPERNACVAP